MIENRNTTAVVPAAWSISLDCICPHCDREVDLLDTDDFWDGKKFQIGEHETPETRLVKVWCPSCGDEFNVKLEY